MNSKETYIKFCRSSENTPLFLTPQWLDATAPSWEVALAYNKDNSLAATFPYFPKNIKPFFTGISNPFLTPYSGPVMFFPDNINNQYKQNSFIDKHIKYLLQDLPKTDFIDINLFPSSKNGMPFYQYGFKLSTRYSQIIPDLSVAVENYSKNIHKRLKSFRGKYKVNYNISASKLFTLIEKVYRRLDKQPYFTEEIINNLVSAAKEHQFGNIIAIEEAGGISCAAFMAYDSDTAYLIVSGSTDEASTSGIISILYHECITYARSGGNKRFDFCGSMIPGVERMNRSFGTIHVPYLNIYKANTLTRILRRK